MRASLLWGLACGALIATSTPATAKVGIFLSNVDEVDGKSGSWRADLILSSEWEEIAFALDAQPQIGLVNAIVDFNDETRHVVNDGWVICTARNTAQLYFDGSYWVFPFDEQQLVVAVEALGKPSSELLLTTDLNFTGIAPVNERTGRHFKTAQFRMVDWHIATKDDYQSTGMPYSKSRVLLSVGIRRHLPYYVLSCFLIPSVIILLSIGAFSLPLSQSTPRVMTGFMAFLSQFVHLRSQMSLLPRGVWCWLFSGLVFSMAVLSMALLGNIVSAKTSTLHMDSAEAHDRYCRWLMPIEYLLGFCLLLAVKQHHVIVMLLCVVVVLVAHLGGMVHFYIQAAAAADDGSDAGSPRKLFRMPLDGYSHIAPAAVAARFSFVGGDFGVDGGDAL